MSRRKESESVKIGKDLFRYGESEEIIMIVVLDRSSCLEWCGHDCRSLPIWLVISDKNYREQEGETKIRAERKKEGPILGTGRPVI